MISLSYQNAFVFALFFETSYNEVAAEHAAEHPITMHWEIALPFLSPEGNMICSKRFSEDNCPWFSPCIDCKFAVVYVDTIRTSFGTRSDLLFFPLLALGHARRAEGLSP